MKNIIAILFLLTNIYSSNGYCQKKSEVDFTFLQGKLIAGHPYSFEILNAGKYNATLGAIDLMTEDHRKFEFLALNDDTLKIFKGGKVVFSRLLKFYPPELNLKANSPSSLGAGTISIKELEEIYFSVELINLNISYPSLKIIGIEGYYIADNEIVPIHIDTLGRFNKAEIENMRGATPPILIVNCSVFFNRRNFKLEPAIFRIKR